MACIPITRHDSAHKHVTGDAVYIDDMPEPAGTLHIGIGLSSVAHGKIDEASTCPPYAQRPAWSMC